MCNINNFIFFVSHDIISTSPNKALIPNINVLFDCPYYWGKIDPNKAKSLFEGKSDGSFTLKESEVEEFSLELMYKCQSKDGKSAVRHGSIKFDYVKKESNKENCSSCKSNLPNHCHLKGTEKWLQKLIDDIKQNFNLHLEKPIMRNHPFSLQDLAAAKTCDLMKNYENISQLEIPKHLKECIRKYHCTIKLNDNASVE